MMLSQPGVAHPLLFEQIAQLRVLHEHVLGEQIVVDQTGGLLVQQLLLLVQTRMQHADDGVVLRAGFCAEIETRLNANGSVDWVETLSGHTLHQGFVVLVLTLQAQLQRLDALLEHRIAFQQTRVVGSLWTE